MPRPITATIHTAAMAQNLALARAQAPGTRSWAVIKADAYGHSIQAAFQGFSDADGLALIEIENAVRLREMGWTKPILLLEGCYDALDWRVAAEHRLSCVVHCEEQLAILEVTALPRKVDVYLKFNSGMNRLGFRLERLRDWAARALGNASIGEVVLMTHFARADEPNGYVEQLRRFNEAADGVPLARSVVNSAACFDFEKSNGTMGSAGHWIRPGIMLYGATPFTHAGKSAASLKLNAAMTLSTEIIGVQSLAAGDAVGYGATYIASKAEQIAIIACGYADGYPRHATTGTPVLVGGVRAPLVGRVSMDKITVDITQVPMARVGTRVELWGQQLAVDEVANHVGTIGYELLTAVAPRVPRRIV
ncbi:MAG: alanine racemase [Burkholderiales bacterium]|nr:MAG: alanine racemase [Betaproteobacteria bacterium]TAG28855.1 MAG: alanine racemase [Burkholderiales bacterium]